jgi:hypothetical protein
MYHDDKGDLFNSFKQPIQDRYIFITPSHQSRPAEIEKNLKNGTIPNNEPQNNRF